MDYVTMILSHSMANKKKNYIIESPVFNIEGTIEGENHQFTRYSILAF